MILDEICAHKRAEVDAAKVAKPVGELQEEIDRADAPRPFRDALREPGISLIAEIKRASPSKGLMLKDIDPANLAALYEQSHARVISVVTDEKYFKGTLEDFVKVRKGVHLPCLRKEFIIDEYQIYEARAAGADAVLLITRILDDEQLEEYLGLVEHLGMKALVETDSEAEIDRALTAGAHIVGINNRNLATFEVDINKTLELRKRVPGGNVLVSESGIRTREDVRRLEDGGIDAVLIGEALVTSSNIQAKILELLGIDES